MKIIKTKGFGIQRPLVHISPSIYVTFDRPLLRKRSTYAFLGVIWACVLYYSRYLLFYKIIFSGTRRFDGLKVAIKQVPKTKVKRWGRVQGRMVPIEFELLDKVSDGHKGIVQMIDWYERRSR